ncbi:hypothetical protein [Halobacteriovorax sp. HLS]|uniref:hypothetical protein n=1 Tax=Halobacteriovorax sp. HLS TaxID=2234000 RepID=UPI000FD87559|nr:hypothetical protein [Halobacteriovorax sp. HLS]
MRKTLILSIVLSFISLAYFARDIKQRNPESLFLTDADKISLDNYKNQFPIRSKLIAFKLGKPTVEKYLELEKVAFEVAGICDGSCDVILPHELYLDRKKFYKSIEDGNFRKGSLIWESSMGMLILTDELKLDVEKKILARLDGEFRVVGHGHINNLLDIASRTVQDRIFPLVFVFSFLILFFVTRKLKNAVILFFAPLYSSLLSLASIKLFFLDMNMVTSIVPLITFIIGLSISLHLYYTSEGFHSFRKAINLKKRPIFLMVVTTFIGFTSLVVSEIEVIRHFGVLCGLLIGLSSIISVAWPLLLEQYFTFSISRKSSIYSIYPRRTFPKKVIAIIFLFSLIGGSYGIRNIKIVTDATNYFLGDNQVKENLSLSQNLSGGVPLVDIILDKSEGLVFSELVLISNLEKEILEDKSIRIHSQLNSIREINSLYTGNNTISDNKFSFLALNSKVPAQISENLLEKSYRITIIGKTSDVDDFMKTLKVIEDKLEGRAFSFNGLFYNLMTSQKEMIHTLAASFFTSLICMSIIVLIVFKKINIFLSFLLVNIFPVGISLCLFPIFGLSLNIATVMTYSIGLGIVVDSSFHIYHSLMNRQMNFHDYYFATVRPIITSSVLLCFCFSLFSLYDFLPIREFGINLSIIIFLGLIFDLFVLPTLFLKNTFLFGDAHENL